MPDGAEPAPASAAVRHRRLTPRRLTPLRRLTSGDGPAWAGVPGYEAMTSRCPGPWPWWAAVSSCRSMAPVDAALLDGRPPRAAFLPTAAALEGDERFDYWVELGRAHFEALGVEPVLVPVRTRADAEDPRLAGDSSRGRASSTCRGATPTTWPPPCATRAVWAAIVDGLGARARPWPGARPGPWP